MRGLFSPPKVGFALLVLSAAGARLGQGMLKPGFGTLSVHFEFETAAAATSLVQNGTLGHIYPGVPGPSAHVSPVYPLLLAALRAPFGVHSSFALVGQSLLSCLFAGLAIAMLPLLGRAAGLAPAAGWLAGFALALVPIPTFYDDILGCWEQPLATFIAEVLLWRLLRARAHPCSARPWLGLGLGLGLLGLTSPSLLPAVVLPAALVWGRSGPLRWRAALLASISFLLVLTPWTTRNAILFGQFIPFRSNFPLELAIGNHDQANGRTYITFPGDKQSPFFNMHPFTSPAEQEKLRIAGEVAYMAEKKAQVLSWIRSHPDRFVELCLTRLRLYFVPTRDLWANASLAEFRCLVTGVVSLFGLLGCVRRLMSGDSRTAAMMLFFLIGAASVYVITHIDLRYRYAANGLLTLAAVDLLLAAYRRVRGCELVSRGRKDR